MTYVNQIDWTYVTISLVNTERDLLYTCTHIHYYWTEHPLFQIVICDIRQLFFVRQPSRSILFVLFIPVNHLCSRDENDVWIARSFPRSLLVFFIASSFRFLHFFLVFHAFTLIVVDWWFVSILFKDFHSSMKTLFSLLLNFEPSLVSSR
jgi:hypothetical protein